MIHAKESASLKMFFQESLIRGKPAFALK